MSTFKITIGTKAQATALFSYPNDGHEDLTLQETVLHWLTDSLKREGVGVTKIAVKLSAGNVVLTFNHAKPEVGNAIVTRYQNFLNLGRTGLNVVNAFKQSDKWSDKWKFLLPLGLPMEFANAVEIMDFPPVTLINKQDYLNSKTTNRWWDLLKLNGVPTKELPRYSCIVDIVPVAAPASDGKNLDDSGIYNGPIDDYSMQLLKLFTDKTGSTARRPMIALGRPIRSWISRLWNKNLNVLDVTTLTVDGNETAPILMTNHPSLFFYVASAHDNEPDGEVKNLAAGLTVLKQDIVAASWHAIMGKNPDTDPVQALADSKAKWDGREQELVKLARKHMGKPRKAISKAKAQAIPKVRKDKLAKLENHFHYGGEQLAAYA
jgi:hypothetical protein